MKFLDQLGDAVKDVKELAKSKASVVKDLTADAAQEVKILAKEKAKDVKAKSADAAQEVKVLVKEKTADVKVICTHFPGHILFTSLNTWMLPCILQGASILFFSESFYYCNS